MLWLLSVSLRPLRQQKACKGKVERSALILCNALPSFEAFGSPQKVSDFFIDSTAAAAASRLVRTFEFLWWHCSSLACTQKGLVLILRLLARWCSIAQLDFLADLDCWLHTRKILNDLVIVVGQNLMIVVLIATQLVHSSFLDYCVLLFAACI